MKVNEGEVPQYYVENSHEAIIQPDEWDAVQLEVARRKAMGRQYSGSSIFGAKLVCGDCGSFYGSKVWNSTRANTVVRSGSAITNSKANSGARRRTWMKMP